MKMRTYYRVNAKGVVVGRVHLRIDQVKMLMNQLILGEKLYRKRPKKALAVPPETA